LRFRARPVGGDRGHDPLTERLDLRGVAAAWRIDQPEADFIGTGLVEGRDQPPGGEFLDEKDVVENGDALIGEGRVAAQILLDVVVPGVV
jgi:hypothetical protein